MEISAIDVAQKRVVIELTRAEAVIVNNALNELVNGLASGPEAMIRIGATLPDMTSMLDRIHYALHSGATSARLLLGLTPEDLRLVDGSLREVLDLLGESELSARISAPQAEIATLRKAFGETFTRLWDVTHQV